MTQQFVGSYVNDVKLALKASALSQEHCLLLSAPGWGKTDIAIASAQKCVGDDYVFLRFAPSTPPQKVEGMFDPQAAISNPPRFELVRTNTAYDPKAHLIIMDELGRPSEVVFDLVIDVLDRRDISIEDAPVVWGTSNFSPTSARQEALRDRIGLWVWIRPGVVDVRSIVNAHAHSLNSLLDIGDFPTWKEIVEVRKADPGPHAIDVCSDLLELLASEAGKAGFEVNPRRTKQWFKILYRTNMYLTGQADFNSLEDDAVKCMIWAWVNTDESKATEWAKIATCVVDIVGTAVSELKSKTLDKVRMLMTKTQAGSSRSALAVELGKIITDGQKEIETLGSDDKRIKKALKDLEEVFVRIARGEDPFAS